MPEIPIPGVPTVAEDLDQLVALVAAFINAENAVTDAGLEIVTTIRRNKAEVVRARTVRNLVAGWHHIDERQHQRAELADQLKRREEQLQSEDTPF